MKIFSIKNEKLNFFNRPVYCESAAEALSYVQNILMSDADRALSGLKDDLVLYELGEIDFEKGSILPSCMTDSSGGSVGEPMKVCSLREIFDTIPTEKLQVMPTRDEMKNALTGLSELSVQVKELFEKVENLEKSPKKGIKK